MNKKSIVTPRPVWVALAAAALSCLPAQAAVVLDTFAPGDLASGANWSLFNGSPSFPEGQYLAVSFFLPEASTLTDILTSIDGFGSFSLGVVAGGGLPSGAFVHSTVLTNPTANSAVNGLSWALDAGSYWLVSRAAPGASGTWAGGQQAGNNWAFTLSPSDAAWASAGSFDAPAARITVTPIPEPGTWALMLGGLALCAAAARRQQG